MVVFLLQVAGDGTIVVHQLGVVPGRLTGAAPGEAGEWLPPALTVLSSMFLHGGWMHMLGNMLFLWVFGDNVEDAMGHGRFLLFYLLCGAAAVGAHAFAEPGSSVPLIGASGAISGVMGAYLMLYPRAKVLTLVLRMVVTLPAALVMGLWIAWQFVQVYLGENGDPSVAWWAHIGGFFAGAVLVVAFRRGGVPLFARPEP